MAYYWSPKAVTDGLIFSVDPANQLSFDSGSAPNDITNLVGDTSITGSLQNGVGYSTDKQGIFTFDGTDDYINCDSLLDTISSDTQGTIECWVKPTGLDSTNEVIFSVNDTSANERINVSIQGTSGALTLLTRTASTTQHLIYSATSPFTNDVWTHIVVVQPGDDTKPLMYADGQEISTGGAGEVTTDLGYWFNDFPANNLDNVRIGDANLNGTGEQIFFNGSISQVRYYNRALTAKEIEQNYNAHRHRYGI